MVLCGILLYRFPLNFCVLRPPEWNNILHRSLFLCLLLLMLSVWSVHTITFEWLIRFKCASIYLIGLKKEERVCSSAIFDKIKKKTFLDILRVFFKRLKHFNIEFWYNTQGALQNYFNEIFRFNKNEKHRKSLRK